MTALKKAKHPQFTLFFFFQIKHNDKVSRNVFLTDTGPPPKGINTFENNSTMNYKTGGERERSFGLKAWGRK